MTRALKLDTDGRATRVEISSLEDLQAAVGGLVQVVDTTIEGHPVDIWLNEEGKLLGLRYNLVATYLWRPYRGLDHIVGDVVLTGGPDREGNRTDLPEVVFESFEIAEVGV